MHGAPERIRYVPVGAAEPAELEARRVVHAPIGVRMVALDTEIEREPPLLYGATPPKHLMTIHDTLLP